MKLVAVGGWLRTAVSWRARRRREQRMISALVDMAGRAHDMADRERALCAVAWIIADRDLRQLTTVALRLAEHRSDVVDLLLRFEATYEQNRVVQRAREISGRLDDEARQSAAGRTMRYGCPKS